MFGIERDDETGPAIFCFKEGTKMKLILGFTMWRFQDGTGNDPRMLD